MNSRAPSPLDFFSRLNWIDGRPLMDTIEPYRRELLMTALYTFRPDGAPLYNMVLSGRAKKNWKSTDLMLAAFYRLLMWESPSGNDCYILANDEGQAGDDLTLGKKLVEANPILRHEVAPLSKGIRRKDGRGEISILPSRDAVGSHGKTAIFIGFDEIHGYRNWDIFEALAPDPTRTDVLQWVTSYDTIFNSPGIPLYDMKRIAQTGEDPRMFFSWYSGDLCTDPVFAELPSEERANPSMTSWPEGPAYLDQQRRRLPSHKFRRLHLNMPGAPDGAYYDGGMVTDAIVPNLRKLPFQEGVLYGAFVDMSGGSSDDACLGIAHKDKAGRRILDLLISQDGAPPFAPAKAVSKFVRALKEYGITEVTGDAYAGLTFRDAFSMEDIDYKLSKLTKTELYEAIEPDLNAGQIELLDLPKLQEQMLTLVVRGSRIDHQPGNHDDWVNAAAGALVVCADVKPRRVFRSQGRIEVSDPLAEFR